MEFSEALHEMIKIIQTGENLTEEYELMLAEFIISQENGDTNRMSLELAKNVLNRNKPFN